MKIKTKHNNTQSLPSQNEEQEIYIGEFLVRTEFLTKESYDRLIIMEAKIGIMTELMMSLRDVVHASMDLDKTIDIPN
tara:strand:+ start:912 stop:1145 length:234 start_codon:yes stop_codon:yes gene_type:complete